MTPARRAALQQVSQRMRSLVLRQALGTRGHIGSALSAVDILACVYFDALRITSQDWSKPDRHRFILSKGHGALALYAALHEAGFLERAVLESYGQPGCTLGGHPSTSTPGVELGTGALGHGLAVAAGMAFAARASDWATRVVVLTGDGELNEGSVWEAALFAAHQGLANLTLIIDRNGMQQEGATESISALEPLADKWRAFGWRVTEVDGHDFDDLSAALRPSSDQRSPLAVVARTVKGKGVSFMEGDGRWHMAELGAEQFALALAEVEGRA